MQYQNQNYQNKEFLQAEQIPAYNGNIPPTGQPYNAQQPIQAQYYQQPYQQPHGYPHQDPYRQVSGGQYQQVVYAQPQLIMVQPANPLLLLEIQYRNKCKWFNGCNCGCSVYILIVLIIQAVILFGGESQVGAGVTLIIGYIIWITSAMTGLYGVSRFNQRLMLYYQIGMTISLVFTIISYIISFSNTQDDGENGNPVIVFIVGMVISIVITLLFIRQGRYIRVMMIEIQELRNQISQQGQGQGQGHYQNR